MKADNVEQEVKNPFGYFYNEKGDWTITIHDNPLAIAKREQDAKLILDTVRMLTLRIDVLSKMETKSCQSNKEMLEALNMARKIISEGNHSDIWKSEQGRKIDTAIKNAEGKSDPRDNPLTDDDSWIHDVDMGCRS